MIKIIKINSYLFDVFYNDGWTFWSRWNRDAKGFLKQVGGEAPPPFVKQHVIKTLKG